MNTTTTKEHTISVLMLGGPADGIRYMLDATLRTFRCAEIPPGPTSLRIDGAAMPPTPTAAKDHCYTIGILFNGRGPGSVNHVGLLSLNDCPIRMLLAGYRKPTAHDSDENVAEQLVTILGGDSDGERAVASSGHVSALLRGTREHCDIYRIVTLVGKDQVHYRVAVRDPQRECPIALLIEGYRKEVGR